MPSPSSLGGDRAEGPSLSFFSPLNIKRDLLTSQFVPPVVLLSYKPGHRRRDVVKLGNFSGANVSRLHPGNNGSSPVCPHLSSLPTCLRSHPPVV